MRPVPVFECPVDAPIEVLGGKWKLVLLFYILQSPRRNGELRRLVPTITQKMLTQQLRELEADGVVIREVHEQVPPKVVYRVHPDERMRLEPLIGALCEWGLYWSAKTGARVIALENIDQARSTTSERSYGPTPELRPPRPTRRLATPPDLRPGWHPAVDGPRPESITRLR